MAHFLECAICVSESGFAAGNVCWATGPGRWGEDAAGGVLPFALAVVGEFLDVVGEALELQLGVALPHC